MKLKADPGTPFTLILLLICFAGVYTAREWQFQARLFPWSIGFPALLLCVGQLALDLFRAKGADNSEDLRGMMDLPVDRSVPVSVVVYRAINIFSWILGFFFVIWLLGFVVSVPLFTLFYMKFQAGENWSVTLIYTAIMMLFLLGVFHYVLHIPWPAGVISQPQQVLLGWVGD